MNKYLIILLSLLFPCMLLAQNKGIRAVDNKGTIIYVDPSKWFQKESNLFNKNTNGNVAIGLDTTNVSFNSRLYISNANSNGATPVLKLDIPFDGELTDDVLTWDPSDFSVRKIPISTLSPNDWHVLGNAGTDPAINFIGTTDDQPLIFKINNQQSGALTSVFSGANTSFGHYSLQNPNVAGGGINNSAFGAGALILTSTGANNTAMGVTALQNNTTGGNNTAVGMNSMTNSITGSDNVAMGALALFGNAAGSGNTAIGASAGYNVSGNYNTLIGLKSGLSITTGANNTVIGGSSAGDISVSAANASNELNIGNALYGTGINNAAGANTGKIGINTNDPQAQLDVNGQARVRNLPTGATTDKIVTADTDGNLRTLLPADLVPATINSLTATNGNLISTVNGVATTPAVPVLISANNGLTSTNGNVQLGGTLTQTPTTTITTDATHTLAITGLQTVAAPTNDNLVTADASGVLHQRTVADAVGTIGWLVKGNAGTTPGTNFLGTTDNQPLMFKVNGLQSGIISVLGAGSSTGGNTGFGNKSLFSMAANSYNNSAVGQEALSLINNGGDNTAIGFRALWNSGNGVANTAVGSQSLGRNTSGQWNSALGYLSLVGITTGSNNSGLGVQALYNVNTGTNNVGIGPNSLVNFTSGSYNIGIGTNTGSAIGTNWYTGSNNILIGMSLGNNINPSALTANNELNIGNTLYGKNVNGALNGTAGVIGINTNAPIATLDVRGAVRTGVPDATSAAIGANSFAGGNGSIASAPNSIAFGSATVSGSTGFNAAFGSSTANAGGGYAFAAGQGNIANGTNSTAFGLNDASNAVNSFTAGTANTVVAGANHSVILGQQNSISPVGSNSTNPGYANFATGFKNEIYSQNSAAFGSTNIMSATVSGAQSSVAMGFSNKTDGIASIVMGSGNTSNGNYSTAIGNGNNIAIGANYSTAIGLSNSITAVSGNILGYNNTVSGTYSTIIGSFADAPNTGVTVIADKLSTRISSTADNQFTGMFNGGYRLLTNRADLTKGMTMDALGNATFSGGVTATGYTPSDIRLKKDIQTLTGVLNNIKQLRGVTYYWKDASKGTDLQLGMIAQELEKVYPELVITNKDTGLKAVNYAQFTGVLVEGIKEQQTQIEDLKSEVETLKKQMQEIKDLLKK